MNNKCIIDTSLLLTLHREPRYVVRLITYIIDKLNWNKNLVAIIPKVVALESKIDRGDISRGMRRLEELNIIHKVNDVYSDHYYTINSDYILKVKENESKN